MSAVRPDIWLISYSHHNCSVEERDRLAFTAEELAEFVPGARTQIEAELAVLSTCNRTEFYGYGADTGAWEDKLVPLVHQTKHIDPRGLAQPSRFTGSAAARHLFRVSASMESLALGEDQILAQVKDVHRQIIGLSGKSPVLDRLYQFAIRAGKRVRTETTLCDGAVSISSAAVELSKRIFGDMRELQVLLVGAGETGEHAAEHFRAAGATRFAVVNRGEERGRRLADRFGGEYYPLEELEQALKSADVAVFATGASDHLLTKKLAKPLMRRRSFRQLFVIDISNPRNVEPSVGGVSGVFLYNIDDLQEVIRDNLKSRQKELPAAEAIIEEVVQEWEAWMQTTLVRPTIASLAQTFERIRAEELERHGSRYSAEQLEAVEAFSKGLTKKLLHNPIAFLRQSIESGELKPEHVDVVRSLFNLDGTDDD